MTVSIVELKAKVSEMVARAEAGEVILISRNGKVVAQLQTISRHDDRGERMRRFQSELALLPKPNPPITTEEIVDWVKAGRKF